MGPVGIDGKGWYPTTCLIIPAGMIQAELGGQWRMTAQLGQKIAGHFPTSPTPAYRNKGLHGTIAASFPSTILLMLLRPDTRGISVIHSVWKQARDKTT